jgi:hypothetical protein
LTSFSPLGDLVSGGVLRDYFTSLPPLPSPEAPFFSGERCRGIHPSIRPFNRSPGHYRGVHCTHLSLADLPAVIHDLFARGSEGSLCMCGQRRGPSSGLWPDCWAPCGRFHRTARFGRIQLVGFALTRGGSGCLLGERSLPPAEPGWCSLDWPVGCLPVPCDLAVASAPLLLFLSAKMSRFSCRKRDGDNRSPRLALKKASSSADITMI